jgi:drug/metabolite transporter (DMT)-like permease
VTRLIALLGVVAISFSAVFIRLAAVSPVTAAFFRAFYAVPALALIGWLVRARDQRTPGARLLALASGTLLAFDLALFHESIALVGVGLATVLANVQVVFVAIAGWLLYGERLSRRTLAIIAAVLVGAALMSGLSRPDAYGTAPVMGVLLGAAAGACYGGFLLAFRPATRGRASTSGALLDATIGTALGALLVSPFDPHFSLMPIWPAHGWLVMLALLCQVAGWLMIARALPLLPAVETSILLMGQPVLAVVWGLAFFGERLSPIQWAGTCLVLAGLASSVGSHQSVVDSR